MSESASFILSRIFITPTYRRHTLFQPSSTNQHDGIFHSIRSFDLYFVVFFSCVCVRAWKNCGGGQVQSLVHLSPSLSLQLNNNHIREKSQINIELNALKIIKKILRFDFCFRPHLYIVPPY